MKKFFTLISALVAFAATGTAKQALPVAFNPWGETCVVDGNSLTFSAAWAGAGNWLNFIDLTDYDCIVVKFAEPTEGDMQLCTEYADPATKIVEKDGDGNEIINYDLSKNKFSTMNQIPAGSKVVKVDLDIDHADLTAQFWIQSKAANCKCVIAECYAGTEEEYLADLADNPIEVPETVALTLTDLGSGWGDSTYDAATQTITIGSDWSGKGWWLGDVDYSHYAAVVVEFAEATAANGKVVVESNDGGNDDAGAFDVNCLVKVAALAPGAEHTKQVYIQGPAATQYKIAAAYVATAEYIAANGIADKYAGTEGINDLKADTKANGAIYNLAGQRVNAAYKGVVIQNGHKMIKK